MIKRRTLSIILLMCMAIVGIAGCNKNDKQISKKKDEGTKKTKTVNGQPTIEGMYLPYGEDEYIFVDTVNHSLFHAEIPREELYNEDEKKIEKADLHKGDMIACYGNGIVLESYPPQYAGISKMIRTKEGTEKDAEQYKKLLDSFYQEPSPAEHPYMCIENRGKDAIITTAASELGYEWSYQNENGETQTIVVDAVHVLQAEDLIDLNCNSDNSDLKLTFSKKPESVKVTSWNYGATIEEVDKGENVKVELEGKDAFIKDAKRTSVYEVTAAWKNGNVIYGFYVR